MNIIKINNSMSTNDYAMSMLSKSEVTNWTTISSDYQIKGKGRNGIWVSEPFKNIIISIIINHKIRLYNIFHLNIISSLSIKKTLDNYLDDVYIKWPNDIICNKRKICGILIENKIHKDKIGNSIIGIGLNVNQTKFPKDISYKATSIKIESQKSLKRDAIINKILLNLKNYHSMMKAGKLDQLLYLYNKYLYKVNKEIYFYNNLKRQKGILKGIDSKGNIIIDSGNIYTFNENDIKLDII